MELKPGYKQTEVGVIPEEWEAMRLADLAELTSSKRIFESDYVPFGIPFYRGKEISLLVEGQAIEDVYYVSDAKYAEIKNRFGAPARGDILITAVGTLGNVLVVNSDEPFYFKDGNLIWLRNIRTADPSFLGIQLRAARTAILGGAIGSSQKALTIVVLKGLKVAVPPDPEQRAIARALGDVDALLGALTKVIAKRRDLKQATMQQLITGKRRLPGFLGEWEVKRLGECLRSRPDYGINAPAVSFSDRLPVYIRITDISDDGRFFREKLVSVGNTNSDHYYLNDGDLVFARTGASVGKSYRYNPQDGRLVFAGFLIRVRPDPDVLVPAYLAACVTTSAYWSWVRLMSMRSGQPGINGNEYAQLPLTLPPVPEQTAIATVLSDMDAEIAGLEQRRDKTRALKQGMMQELLTGRTRLV